MAVNGVKECKNCELTFFQSVTFEKDRVVEFLIKHGVLKEFYSCKNGHICPLRKDSLSIRCHKALRNRKKGKCSFNISAKTGTLFDGLKLPVEVSFKLASVLLHTNPPRHQFIERELGVRGNTLISYFSHFRQVFINHVIANSSILGGPETIVEIIEASLVNYSFRALHIPGNGVIGGIQHDTGNFFLIPVETCDSKTLLEIIKGWISPGTTLVSDCWKTYNCFSDEGFRNLKESNVITFVDDIIISEHTSAIDKCWHEVRGYKSRIGERRTHLYNTHSVGYLAEFQFKWKYRKLTQRLHHFFRSAADMYPPKY